LLDLSPAAGADFFLLELAAADFFLLAALRLRPPGGMMERVRLRKEVVTWRWSEEELVLNAQVE